MQYTTLRGFFLLCLFIGGHLCAQEQQQIEGKITDTKGNPLLGVTIWIPEISKGTTTNPQGYFSLAVPSNNSNLNLNISFVGYVPETRIITPANNFFDISLKESATQLQEVNLTAKNKLQQIEALAYNVDVVDAKKLHHTSLDIGHALDRVSGIRVRESGGVGSNMQLSMNGFRGNQVKVFIDGIPMENFGSSFQLNNIPINLAERIEVYKGVVPVGLGADALGGAINIVTKSDFGNHLDASYSYGSFNTHRSNINAIYTAKSGFTARINAFQNYSDNNYTVNVDVADLETGEYFPNQEVKRFNDNYHNETIIGNIGVVNTSYADKLLLGFTVGQNYNEIQTGARQVSVYGNRHRQGNILMPSLKYQKKDLFTQGLDVTLNANYNFGKEEVVDTVNRRYNWFGEFIEYDSPGGELNYTHLKFQNNNGIANANLNYNINETHKLAISNVYTSFNRKRENLLSEEEQIYNQPQKTTKNVAGLGYTFEKENWSITGFLKNYHQVNTFEEAYRPEGSEYGSVAYRFKKNTFNSLGYGAAGTYFLTDNFQIKASFEKSFRLPQPNELFGDGGVLLQGNSSLKPETSYNYNLGAQYLFKIQKYHQLNLSTNGFYRDAKDFIRPRLNKNQVFQVMDNLADVSNLGIEAEARYSYKNKFSAGANLTYQNLRNNTQFEDGQTQESIVYRDRIPNIPYLYGNADASYTIESPFNSNNSISFSYNLLYVHSFYLYWPSLGSTKLEVPEQIAHDLSMTYSFGKKNNFQFTLEARNLADANLYDNFSLQKPGRNFTAKIRYSF
ncbi:TonB-dependent receptor [Salegentibacter sp. BLCTC]|uniref:TonB-dependent receptor n=1 Tax=Salegentibacter sp. BLCTC TaxID=2697368 RepID=UPI00187B7CB4|nr:TonB-dependent receptor [Salegentibacter sp. BLCTC]MBE7641383.1 TonB-dependent receptor [Salegentibacter sp. BLCTC]